MPDYSPDDIADILLVAEGRRSEKPAKELRISKMEILQAFKAVAKVPTPAAHAHEHPRSLIQAQREFWWLGYEPEEFYRFCSLVKTAVNGTIDKYAPLVQGYYEPLDDTDDFQHGCTLNDLAHMGYEILFTLNRENLNDDVDWEQFERDVHEALVHELENLKDDAPELFTRMLPHRFFNPGVN